MVDGLVFPEGALAGGHGLRVGVVRHGVQHQKDKALAVVAIHPDFQSVHALLDPADDDAGGIQHGGDDGLEGGRVHDDVRADDPQILADGVGVILVGLDVGHQRSEAFENAGRDGRRHGAQHRGHRHVSQRGVAAGARGIFVGGPLLRIGCRLSLRDEGKMEEDGIRRGGIYVFLIEVEDGFVFGQLAADIGQEQVFAIVIGGEPIGFHIFVSVLCCCFVLLVAGRRMELPSP